MEFEYVEEIAPFTQEQIDYLRTWRKGRSKTVTQEPHEYVRTILSLAGFKNPTDELVNEIYATAEKCAIVAGTHPYFIVNDLIAVLRAYYPVTVSLEFIASMEQLQTQAGNMLEEFDKVSQELLAIAKVTPPKPKQKLPYYQRNKAHWWKGKRS